MAPGGMVNVPSARNFTTVDWSERMFVVTLEPVVVTDAGTSAAEADNARRDPEAPSPGTGRTHGGKYTPVRARASSDGRTRPSQECGGCGVIRRTRRTKDTPGYQISSMTFPPWPTMSAATPVGISSAEFGVVRTCGKP